MKFLMVRGHKFEVVNEAPKGYFIWNIGTQNMMENYIPLCEWLNDDKEDYHINLGTLKAIRVNEGWEELMFGASYINGDNFNNLGEFSKTIKRAYTKEIIENFIKHLPQIKGYENLDWRK